jgi:predicted enzyme related to lactoylglutathione lyase
MARTFCSSRDVIVRTDAWAEATQFYESVLGLPVTLRTDTLMGFESGAFCLYVEKGHEHGPVFEFLVPDILAAKRKLIDAGCTIQEENPDVPRCYIRDPFGVAFNLAQARADEWDTTGARVQDSRASVPDIGHQKHLRVGVLKPRSCRRGVHRCHWSLSVKLWNPGSPALRNTAMRFCSQSYF